MFALLVECVALLLGELAMAVACRALIALMLAAVYHLKLRLNQDALARRTRHVLRGHNAPLVLFCLATLFFHLIFARPRFWVYSLVVCGASLLCLTEEYLCIAWLWQIEQQRADSLEVEPSEVVPRKSLYTLAWLALTRQ